MSRPTPKAQAASATKALSQLKADLPASKFLPFARPFIVGKELYYIAQAVQSGHLSGDGSFSLRCHDWLKENLGCPGALLTQSCTAALEMAALLCDVRAGDEVILPSFTFVSTANAFALRGATPVFVDIQEDNLNIDHRIVAEAITDRTRVIVPVHYAGVACDMRAILSIAAKHDVYVVEDAAHALLATDREGRALGTLGNLGCLSFHESKNVISGEGGALLINDPKLIQRAEIIREKGTNRPAFFRGEAAKYTWLDLGSSFLPSELTAAFLYAQFEHAQEITTWRQQLCAQYQAGLAPLAESGDLRLPDPRPSGTGSGHIYYVRVSSEEVRSRLQKHLRDDDIYAVSHYVPLHSSPAGRKLGRTFGEMAVTDRVSATLLRLPLFFEMQSSDVERVIASVFRFFKG
jgi:dTDP-4-amino-4,6-dideoxygalactose transaminase